MIETIAVNTFRLSEFETVQRNETCYSTRKVHPETDTQTR